MSISALWKGVESPFATVEGGKWLSKALDPASIRTDVGGLPDTNSANVCVLNYQTQDAIVPYDVSVTDGSITNAEYTSYDADLFLYQHPIYLGCSASYLSDTTNPADGRMKIMAGTTKITVTKNGGDPAVPTLTIESSTRSDIGVFFSQVNSFSSPVFGPRTVSLIKNEQIPGRTYADQQKSMSDFCQRYRVIYGGAQVIPSCSDNYNSGTVEACQQVFNSGESVSANINESTSNQTALRDFTPASGPADVGRFVTTQVKMLTFNTNDFPNSSDIVQNPQGLLTRYREGVFMPYKIVNPLNHPYLTAEEQKVINAPFWITGAQAKLYDTTNINNHKITKFPSGNNDWIQMVWDRKTNGFILPETAFAGNGTINAIMGWVVLNCVNYLGIGYNILIYMPSLASVTGADTFRLDGNANYNSLADGNVITFNSYFSTDSALNIDGSVSRCAFNTVPLANRVVKSGSGLKYQPAAGGGSTTIVDWLTGGGVNNGVVYSSSANRITVNQDASAVQTLEGNQLNGMVTFPQHSRIGVINFRSISTTAGMKMLIRIGNEITLSSGTIYSMFKHRSPSYDENAIKSYLRCIHEMKDAFYGDAASDEGHDKYADMIRSIVWQTPPSDYITTQGINFSGQVSV